MALCSDFGTTWTKLYDTETGERRIVRTDETKSIRADLATGHNAGGRASRVVNELITMAQGGLSMLGNGEYTILDVGSRDLKFVSMSGGKLDELNWSQNCAALTGFTLELLGEYYKLDFAAISPSPQIIAVTCGTLGMEKIFELISGGVAESEAIARFTRGLATNAYRFVGRGPKRIYLSGGMCDNPLFLASFPEGVEVIPLGRFLLIEGLLYEMGQTPNTQV